MSLSWSLEQNHAQRSLRDAMKIFIIWRKYWLHYAAACGEHNWCLASMPFNWFQSSRPWCQIWAHMPFILFWSRSLLFSGLTIPRITDFGQRYYQACSHSAARLGMILRLSPRFSQIAWRIVILWECCSHFVTRSSHICGNIPFQAFALLCKFAFLGWRIPTIGNSQDLQQFPMFELIVSIVCDRILMN
jgi:hypothetical protein